MAVRNSSDRSLSPLRPACGQVKEKPVAFLESFPIGLHAPYPSASALLLLSLSNFRLLRSTPFGFSDARSRSHRSMHVCMVDGVSWSSIMPIYATLAN